MEILNTRCNNPTFEEALQLAAGLLEHDSKANIFFLNIDCLYKASQDAEYRNLLNTASLVLPDGIGIDLAARFSGTKVKANCNGTDFSPVLMRHAAEKGYKVFLLGGTEGVATRAAEKLSELFPKLKVTGARSGYFDSDEEVIEQINRSGADILLVAMGVPLQEKWIGRHREKLKPRLCVGVGALLDFWSGRMRREQLWIRMNR